MRVLSVTIVLTLAGAATARGNELFVAFWNVENLFDTVDDLTIEGDEEFTPSGPREWTTERYEKKLQNLAQVIHGMNAGKGPDVLGLCEIENAAVIKDLLTRLEPLKRKYRLIHRDSPSGRGIDCAILVDEARAAVDDATFHAVPEVRTREIVEARLHLNGKPLFVFMNHWPSRGGDKDGEQRERAASVLRKRVDELLKSDAGADIVIGGDLNDHVNDRSIREVLRAETDKSKLHDGALFDTMATVRPGIGTIFFEGRWEIIDHVIISRGLLDERDLRWQRNSTTVIRNDCQLFKPRDGEPRPNRTFGGDKYHGGYSDHMPVACTLEF